jgi:hypothetical protein
MTMAVASQQQQHQQQQQPPTATTLHFFPDPPSAGAVASGESGEEAVYYRNALEARRSELAARRLADINHNYVTDCSVATALHPNDALAIERHLLAGERLHFPCPYSNARCIRVNLSAVCRMLDAHLRAHRAVTVNGYPLRGAYAPQVVNGVFTGFRGVSMWMFLLSEKCEDMLRILKRAILYQSGVGVSALVWEDMYEYLALPL